MEIKLKIIKGSYSVTYYWNCLISLVIVIITK